MINDFNKFDAVRKRVLSPKELSKEAPYKAAIKEYNLRSRVYKSTGEECISIGGLAPNIKINLN